MSPFDPERPLESVIPEAFVRAEILTPSEAERLRKAMNELGSEYNEFQEERSRRLWLMDEERRAQRPLWRKLLDELSFK